MLDVCLLGTGGMMPLPYRWLTSLMVRYNGSSLLIDCGEGSYQRTSGPASYNGKCRPYQTAYINRAKRAGTGSKCPARDRTGAAVPD